MNLVEHNWDPGGKRIPNHYLFNMICHDVGKHDFELDDDFESRTELDTYINMPLVGKYAMIIDDLHEEVNGNAFSPYYPALKAKMVDAAIKYDCPYTGTSYKYKMQYQFHQCQTI
jgi:hypothetical protein